MAGQTVNTGTEAGYVSVLEVLGTDRALLYAFLFALVPRAWGLAPEDLVISMWTGSGSAESPGLLGFPVSSLTREAGLRMT